MKIPIPILPVLLLLVISAGCGSSTDSDSISSHTTGNNTSVLPDCLACHSSAQPSLDPLFTNGSGTAGKHIVHVSEYGMTCQKCHYNYPNQSTHMNGTLDTSDPALNIVYFDSVNPYGLWINDAGNCSNVYCHSIGQTASGGPLTPGNSEHYKTPAWAGGEASCASCHGNPPDSGSHQKHASGGTGQYTYTCEQCHSGYVPPGATATHADGAINTTISTSWGGAYKGDSTPGNGFSYCSNIYCHSDGTSVATGKITTNDSPTWGNAALACNSCHGYPPSYPQMTDTTASPKANAHAYHMANGINFTCRGCHYDTTTTDNTITAPANHANGKYDVKVAPDLTYEGKPVSFTYVPDSGGLGGSCDNVTCHGSIPNTWFWGKFQSLITGITTTNGPSCFEAKFAATGTVNVKYPVTYTWAFGDGQTESGTSDTLPSSSSHKYFDHTQRRVTITGRDAMERYFSRYIDVIPQPIGNKPPYANWQVTTNRYTVTLTDLSTDEDYDTCGNGLAGSITIAWGDYFNTKKYDSINFTKAPSNKTYTFIYYDDPTISSDKTYTITHTIVDYAGAQALNSPQTKSVAVPGQTVISGRITLADNVTGVAGVTVDLKYLKGIYGFLTLATIVTDADGSYSFRGQGYDYNRQFLRVEPRPSAGYSFSPSYQDVAINRNDVNFTASSL